MKLFLKYILGLFILFLGVFSSLESFADGSKDLYPSGALGNRAFLFSSAQPTIRYPASWPFSTPGTHYVYVKAGERLAVSSSVIGVGSGAIKVISPRGSETTYTSNGAINNRAAELAGPQIPGQSITNRYTPNLTPIVVAADEGIWTVQFLPPSDPSDVGNQNIDAANLAADFSWTKTANQPNTNVILAWDVSVLNVAANAWKQGRTYVNVLNMIIDYPGADLSVNTKGFNSSVYVLTKDGVTYHVNNNGQKGMGFTFFVNNKGFIDGSGTPLYKSLNTTTEINTQVHDPRALDDPSNITHKIFYAKPSTDFEGVTTANVWSLAPVSGPVTTWLKKVRETPKMTDLSFVGFEGTAGQVGSKGARVSFTSNVDGTYKIIIPIPSRGSEAAGIRNRILTGKCIPGSNTVIWDGKDALGDALLPGLTISSMSTQLFGAEIHFPFIDVEVNQNGIIIQQLKDLTYDTFTPIRDTVYWDDRLITTTVISNNTSNPLSYDNTTSGVSSTANGHKWGQFGSSPKQWGDNKSIDTWSYVPGALSPAESINVVIMSGDLEVSSLTKSPSGAQNVSIGSNLTYSATIRNTGPDAFSGAKAANFFFHVPRGVTINPADVTFGSTTGGAALNGVGVFELVSSSLSPISVYRVKVNMPLNSSGVFTIPVTVTAVVPTRHVNAWASILRSNDITDPNATNTNITIPNPIDAFQEANGIYKLVSDLNLNADITTNTDFVNLRGSIAGTILPSSADYTNNIKYNNEVQMFADLKVTKTVTPASSHTIGQQITFDIKAENLGESVATNTIVNDLLSSRFAYVSHIAPAGTTYDKITGIWDIGNLAKGQVLAPLQIVATINATGGAQINTATISADEFDINLTNNEASVATSVPTSLSITKTGVRTNSGNTAGTASFVITVKNTGTIDASGIQVIDQLPSRYNQNPPLYSVSVGTASHSGTGNRTITWELGSLAPGAEAYLFVTSNFGNGSGSLTNTAEITGGPNDSATPANSSGNTRDLQVTKSVLPITQNVGQNVVFTITTSRVTGSGSANNVVIKDLLPPGYTYVSNTNPTAGTYNDGTSEWAIPSLSGTARTLTITAKVNPPTGSVNEYRNIAAIKAGDHVDTDLTNNWAEATVTPILADLKIQKTVSNASPAIGSNVVFTLTASNLGPNNATGVSVADLLPAGYTYVSSNPSVGSFNAVTGNWTIGNLNNAANATLNITAKVNATGPYLNTATITGDQYDPISTNNSSAISVTPGPSLFITNPMIYQRIIKQ